MSLPRVVLIGFNKCATRSFGRLFEAAGHRSLHNKLRQRFRPSINAARLMQANEMESGRIFTGMADYVFYCDLVHVSDDAYYEGAMAFRQIHADYPDTLFVLNLRDREDWIASRLKHGHGEFAERTMRALNLKSIDAVADHWRKLWDAHVADVRAFGAENPGKVIEFDIDKDDIADLCAALPAYHLDPAIWHDTGRSRGRRRNPVSKALASWWSRVRPRSQ
jgi:hypothetical protein